MINTWDTLLFRFLNGFAGKSDIFNFLIIFFGNYLSYLLVITLAIFLLKYAYPRRQAIIVTIISAFVSRFVITEIIRFLYHRPRPFSVMHVTQLIDENKWSFPSGHASFFFAIAAAVYLYNRKWGIAFFIASLFIGVGRVMAGVHYPFDVVGGAAIGIATSYIVFSFVKNYLKFISKPEA